MNKSKRQSKFVRNLNPFRRRALTLESLEERRVMAVDVELVKDIFAGTGDSFPTYSADLNGTLFFRARDAAHGYELWKSDGTTAGTTIVKDINTGASSSNLVFLTNVNGILFFTAVDAAHGYELWKSDGTAAGTTLVKDLEAGTNSSYPRSFTNVNGTLYFTASDATNGRELWKSDGTAAGTTLVKDIYAGTHNSDPEYLININGTLYFAASDANGRELWKSDGTTAGTAPVRDVANPLRVAPQFLTNVNGTIFFSASDAAHGDELWKYDGTTAGPTLVKDIYAGTNNSFPALFTNFNGTLFFTAQDSDRNSELWKSDGTADGTVLVKDIFAEQKHSSVPSHFTNVNGTLFFSAVDAAHGSELWKTDGTTAGTTLVKDIEAGTISSAPDLLTNVNGTLFFSATDTIHGREIWKSDGTPSGTTLVKDIFAGKNDSSPFSLTNVNGTLFFGAQDATHGYELWRTKIVQNPPTTVAVNAAGAIEIHSGGIKEDNLTVVRSGADIKITDNTPDPLDIMTVSGVTGATLSANKKSVTIPLATIEGTGKPLLFNLSYGTDLLLVDTNNDTSNSPIPTTGLMLGMGNGSDRVALINNNTVNTWNITGPQSGSVSLGSLGKITFSGVEQIRADAGEDTFRITNPGINQINSINGGAGAGANSLVVVRDANFTLTDAQLTVTPLGNSPVPQTFSLANIKRATLTGGAGNNIIKADAFFGSVQLTGGNGNDVLIGGHGNDILNGGSGDDWLSGKDGDDTLLGYNGRDILVGGLGADKLNDAAILGSDTGDDLLIGGSTNYDAATSIIDLFLTSWANPYIYSGHITKLTSGVGPQNIYKLTASTVLDDNAIDALYGGLGTDWFFAGTSGTKKDTHDKSGIEQVVNV